jgi:SAM-dependent methyltransferase
MPGVPGPEFYDDNQVFQTYLQHRRRVDSANDTLEKPVLWEMLGPVAGLRILDLGCGDGAAGVDLLGQGAAAYLGVEGSHNMAGLARQALSGTSGEIVQADMQSWEYPAVAFDRVISRLALHYLPDLQSVFERVFRALQPGGRFVFSVEHPVITSCDRGWQSGVRQDWLVDDYFDTGVRTTQWMGGEVIKYHRTVEQYFLAVQAAGFVVEQLRESHPRRENFQQEATYLRRRRIPLFLFIGARKP